MQRPAEPCSAVLHRAAPCCTRQPHPIAIAMPPAPSLSATSQYVDPLRGACASCDDVRWNPALPVLLATLALALVARRLFASVAPHAVIRAARRVPLCVRPPIWMGNFAIVVYFKIIWSARTRTLLHSPTSSPTRALPPSNPTSPFTNPNPPFSS